MHVGESKDQIRRAIRARRDSLDESERVFLSAGIVRRALTLQEYRQAKTVMLYCTHGSEVRTESLVDRAIADGKQVVMPKVSDITACRMRVYGIRSRDALIPGAYGILEPDETYCSPIASSEVDIVFVPGVVFDTDGHRIGHGKGYFDRWMAALPAGRLVGLAYDFQVLERVPCEEHDIAVGTIVTDKRIIQCDERGHI